MRSVMMRRRLVFYGAALLTVAGAASTAFAADDALWNALLTRHVKEGRVDYRALLTERAALTQYLAGVAATDPSALPTPASRLAFWINAYNACVFDSVLERYPLRSVRDVRGFFDGIRHRVAGRELTLNEIEREVRNAGDWRIHFAIVCASASCPPLRAEAYAADRLDAQLAEQIGGFLRDAGHGLRIDGGTLWLSKIFDWYAADFTAHGRGFFRTVTPASLAVLLGPLLEPHTAETLAAAPLRVKFLPYDWSLNAYVSTP